jgi:hypothetical protein
VAGVRHQAEPVAAAGRVGRVEQRDSCLRWRVVFPDLDQASGEAA